MFILSNIWLVLLFIKEALLLLLQHVEGAARPLIDLRWASNKAELDLCVASKRHNETTAINLAERFLLMEHPVETAE